MSVPFLASRVPDTHIRRRRRQLQKHNNSETNTVVLTVATVVVSASTNEKKPSFSTLDSTKHQDEGPERRQQRNKGNGTVFQPYLATSDEARNTRGAV
ncbi:hypothetical protein V6N11_034292 [Hibiscus sabdariffa]|uniref:Uncharacterized protein n=2 Tax=Hibiscus sabdariffa TaxID=183260 RepID=A0ABR2CCW6_9ROSI